MEGMAEVAAILKHTHAVTIDDAASVAHTEVSKAVTTKTEQQRREIITQEEVEEGAVSMTVYLRMIRAMGGVSMFCFLTLLVSAGQAAVIAADYW